MGDAVTGEGQGRRVGRPDPTIAMKPLRHVSLLSLCAVACACASDDAARRDASNPALAEVPLEAEADDWNAQLLFDNGDTGIWTVKSFQVFDQLAQREVVGLDDEGTCWVLVGYSGKWTPLERVHDGKWLGGLTHGDVDPRIEGAELYTGGQGGNLYQLTTHRQGALDARLIAHFPGEELHTIVQGELDPRSPGPELLVFTRPGSLYRVAPTGDDGRFEVEPLGVLDGRVRDAVVLRSVDGASAEVATVSRAGALELLRLDESGAKWTTLHEAQVGMGRIALGASEPPVLYTTLDDGRIARHARAPDGTWSSEVILIDEQGPRGLAAGRFHEDPEVETVALFGYGREVRLLSRRPGEAWAVETLFVDRDKGHWLSACEIDGRNGTRELIGSGYGGRIFLLSRPPGYGL